MNSGDDLYRYASMYTRQNSFGESILGEARKKDWNIKIRSMKCYGKLDIFAYQLSFIRSFKIDLPKVSFTNAFLV